MELIKSSSEVMPYDDNPLKHIELVARNCYKSEDKITNESCTPFVQMLKDRKHMAMLEFYPFYFHIDTEFSHRLLSINNLPDVNGDLMLHNDPHQPYTQASCNLRTAMMISKYDGYLAGAIHQEHPSLYFLFDSILSSIGVNNYCHLVQEDMVVPVLRYLTGRFICDRGVSHELVRHRMCSFAQESTRYCNYGKDDVKFIIPSWIHVKEGIYKSPMDFEEVMSVESDMLFGQMFRAEGTYSDLIKLGYAPQQARTILPNSLKTEIIVQARLSEWKHIFEQRCSKSAHPDMQALMIPFKEKVCKHNSEYNTYLNS
jgi:thymidylate synthase (FAD)